MISEKEQQIHLEEYIKILLKNKWVVISFFVMVVTIVAIGTFKARPVYRATSQLLIDKENVATRYQEGISLNISDQDYYQSQYRIMKSRTLAKRVVDRLQLQDFDDFKNIKDVSGAFLGSVYIDPIRGSRLVNLSVESYSPKLAALMSNALADEYIAQNLENKLFASREILKKLPKGIPVEKLTKNDDSFYSLPSVVNNGLIQKLKADHITLETQYAELSKKYKDKHPRIQGIRSALEELNNKINIETNKVIESIRVELSGNFEANNVRIIDYAEIPTSPIKPKKRFNFLLSLVIGLIGGAGLAFFIDYMDNTIKNENDIEQYLNMAFLGFIPKIRNKEKNKEVIKRSGGRSIFVLTQPKAPATEAMKSIRSNIAFSAPKDQLKSILITSAGPSEGKTIISVNLAVTFAQYGEKTIIIDCDLRRSSLHKVFKVEEHIIGMSSYLIGEASISGVIQKTEIENLDVIFAGHHPPNPAELLNPDRFRLFLDELGLKYDRIIIDSPPIMPVSDSINLSTAVNGIIQVIRYSKLNKEIVFRAKEKLSDSKAKIIGAILNGVDIESSGHYYYPYQYYYYDSENKKETD